MKLIYKEKHKNRENLTSGRTYEVLEFPATGLVAGKWKNSYKILDNAGIPTIVGGTLDSPLTCDDDECEIVLETPGVGI